LGLSKLQNNKRIHSLDSLRAVMMILGIVLHSAVTYSPLDMDTRLGIFQLKDPLNSHISNGFIVEFIHSFRIQIFFLVAGFFASLLYYEKSPRQMIKNRISRILFPFLVFETFLGPFFKLTKEYSIIKLNFLPDLLSFPTLKPFIGHFWFLYYLIIITFLFTGLIILLSKFLSVGKYFDKYLRKVLNYPILKLVVFSFFTFSIYTIMNIFGDLMPSYLSNFFMPNTFPSEPRITLLPNPLIILYYSSFYAVGWILFRSKKLLDSFKSFDWIYFLSGTLLFTFLFFNTFILNYFQMVILKSVITWLLIFGITGIFIRYFSNFSSRAKYISDSSYWIYLTHIEFCYLIPCFIVTWNIPSTFKFLIVTIITTIICFTTYHYFVRNTFIGNFLNGRKYPRKVKI
jgi:hypothetical protein